NLNLPKTHGDRLLPPWLARLRQPGGERSGGPASRSDTTHWDAIWLQFGVPVGSWFTFYSYQAQATEIAMGLMVLNRMLDLGRPYSVRVP
ncbi:hypothetical protein J2847_006808, partial [Azospirillum agricola]|nr:hypothetical protein [Azospirillum agricola]